MTESKQLKGLVMSLNDFVDGATESTLFKEVTEQIIQEENKELLNKADLKRAEDWGVLANQVVGSETY